MRKHPIPHHDRGTARHPYAVSTRWLAAAAVVPALGLMSACGGDDSSADSSADSGYCKALTDAKPHFATLQEGDVAKYDEAFAGFHELAAESPDSIKDDWAAFDGALVNLEDALAPLGLEVSDLAAVTAGDVPKGTDPADLAAVPDLLFDLISDEFLEAATNIERHALDECDVELAV